MGALKRTVAVRAESQALQGDRCARKTSRARSQREAMVRPGLVKHQAHVDVSLAVVTDIVTGFHGLPLDESHDSASVRRPQITPIATSATAHSVEAGTAAGGSRLM
jgi:hypothetical protein